MLNACVETMSGGPPHRALQHDDVIGHLRSGLKPGCFPLGVAGGPVLTFLYSQQEREHSDPPEHFKFHSQIIQNSFELIGFFFFLNVCGGGGLQSAVITLLIKSKMSGLGVWSGLPAGVTALLKGEACLI